jgi:hypothetical protein
MAKVKPNSPIASLSGKLGDKLVFRQRKDGTTIVTVMPDFSDRVFSEGQLATQSRFKEASAYAKVAAKTQPVYAELAERTHQAAYNLALSDWFRAPVIHEVRRLEGRLRVQASDNVLVTRVVVTLLDEQGQTLEQGEAMRVNDAWWEFLTLTQGHVIAEAWDPAGNVTKYEI